MRVNPTRFGLGQLLRSQWIQLQGAKRRRSLSFDEALQRGRWIHWLVRKSQTNS